MILLETWMLLPLVLVLCYFCWFFYDLAKRKYKISSGKEYLDNLLNSISDSEKWRMYSINYRTILLSEYHKATGSKKTTADIAREAVVLTDADFKVFCLAANEALESIIKDATKEK